jgi:hypothetical protein
MTTTSKLKSLAAIFALTAATGALAQSSLDLTNGATLTSVSGSGSLSFSNNLLDALNAGTVQVTPVSVTQPVVTPPSTSGSPLTISGLSIDLSTNTLYGNLISGGSVNLSQFSGLSLPSTGSTITTTGGSLVLSPIALDQLGLTPGAGGLIDLSTGGSVSVTTIPEPGTWALLGLGLVGVSLARRRVK